MHCINSHSRQIALFLGVAAMAFVVGCGSSDTGRVAGHVTIGGKPLDQGAVVFQDAKKGAAILAPIGNDGTYRVKTSQKDGLPPGDYQVAIQPQSSYSGPAPLAAPPKQQKKAESPIPTKYRSVKTSGLKVTVKQGDNPPFDFDLAQ